ncbi:hypothetical protein HPP92_000001 [Vanilla planifolia]|uniref:Inhibitor I9 domain-containing protein n=1 Tax=Vanilla planifolia TaxID=51239 RepID=A0A835VGK9_VANPL|nr:hypothetical protein HPP92_000001 [Vanilla planifolia]
MRRSKHICRRKPKQRLPGSHESFFHSYCSPPPPSRPSLNVTALPTNRKTFVPIGHDEGSHRIYIVHVTKPSDKKFHLFKQRKEWYMSYLPNTTLSSGWPRLVYAYRQVITGFAAWLTQEEVNAMTTMDGFLFSSQDDDLQPRTTYTYEFLGLTADGSRGMWYNSNYGAGQIIGVIDWGDAEPPFLC